VGGKLVTYRSGFSKQLLLERYFNASGWVAWQSEGFPCADGVQCSRLC
jgi:hypothetical protein